MGGWPRVTSRDRGEGGSAHLSPLGPPGSEMAAQAHTSPWLTVWATGSLRPVLRCSAHKSQP